ncbi:hypothetical protein HID58_064772 [Brassica napus]|uniref:Uncharacterized protein n=1 Tax=Brassica napus TaxID=3708 RepID=A0ABQ7ZBA5_BRANA|nr:hypothetical protein HID58_064772 [Brassica napus]
MDLSFDTRSVSPAGAGSEIVGKKRWF